MLIASGYGGKDRGGNTVRIRTVATSIQSFGASLTDVCWLLKDGDKGAMTYSEFVQSVMASRQNEKIKEVLTVSP